MSRHFSRESRNDKLVATKFLCCDTRHLCRDNYKTTSTELCCDIVKLFHDRIQKKKAQNYVAIETASHDKSWETKMTTMSRHNFLCRDKETN